MPPTPVELVPAKAPPHDHHYRGRGIGRAAARATFERFPPGEWVVTEVPRNTGAIAFWRKVIGELGDYSEEQVPGDVIQRFRTTTASA